MPSTIPPRRAREIFSGSFALEAARAVVGAPAAPHAAEIVSRLVDRRLLSRADGDAWRLLETIKEHARSLPHDREAASLRHARHHADRVEALASELRAEGVEATARALFDLRDEIFSAARRCVAAGDAGRSQRGCSSARPIHRSARSTSAPSSRGSAPSSRRSARRRPSPFGARAALAVAAMAIYTCDRATREADIARAEEIVPSLGDPALRAELDSIVAPARANDGLLDEAEAAATRAVARPDDAGLRAASRARESLTEVARQRGDIARAEVLESALARAARRAALLGRVVLRGARVRRGRGRAQRPRSGGRAPRPRARRRAPGPRQPAADPGFHGRRPLAPRVRRSLRGALRVPAGGGSGARRFSTPRAAKRAARGRRSPRSSIRSRTSPAPSSSLSTALPGAPPERPARKRPRTVLRMRQLGLREVVLTTEEGDLFDPSVPVARVSGGA